MTDLFNISEPTSDSHPRKQSLSPQIDIMSLIARLEAQQKTIGELQVKLHHVEEKAVNLDNRVFQMRALLQSGKGFSQILNLSNLLDSFMAVCRERYASINSVVLLLDDLDPTEIQYRIRGYYGLKDSFFDVNGNREEMFMFKMPYDRGLLWQLIHQGDVFAVRDMRKLPRFETAFRKWNLGVLQSDIWVPLIRGSDVLGILTLGECEDGSQIPESDYCFLEEIAAVAATNIDSTLKYEKNGRILANLRTLYDVNQQLANVNDFKRLMKDTLSTAVEALQAQKANLMLLNRETQRFEIKVVWGNIPSDTINAINEGSLETKTFGLGEGVAGLAAQRREAVRINDRGKIDQMGKNPVYCILSVPIIFGNEVEGVITMTNKIKTDRHGRAVLDPLSRFGEDDEQLLLSLARQAAANLNKARLYNASITDKLTGLNNTRHFESRLRELMTPSNGENKNICLAIVDIDHFKLFNDQYGHKAGDFVLTRTAHFIRTMEDDQSGNECFRYGGEEFCVLLPMDHVRDSAACMDVIRRGIEASVYEWGVQKLKVQVSIGVASSRDYTNSALLFEQADKALYLSKGNGRNRVTYLDGDVPVEYSPRASQSDDLAPPDCRQL
ncbi:MAG: diguanylate cyclase [Deltaproteobacteria bacterium]|nr:diguanylate cyclase [Deltaproteobacteria bacterium]